MISLTKICLRIYYLFLDCLYLLLTLSVSFSLHLPVFLCISLSISTPCFAVQISAANYSHHLRSHCNISASLYPLPCLLSPHPLFFIYALFLCLSLPLHPLNVLALEFTWLQSNLLEKQATKQRQQQQTEQQTQRARERESKSRRERQQATEAELLVPSSSSSSAPPAYPLCIRNAANPKNQQTNEKKIQ